MKTNRQPSFLLWGSLIGVWLLFTVSLTIWWYIYGIEQLSALSEAAEVLPSKIMASQRMLFMEGACLVLCLIGGAGMLAWLLIRERRARTEIEKFFATFSHELRTPLASLQLQVEGLKEDLTNASDQESLERIIQDTSRLTLHLENSMQLAEPENTYQHQENISLASFLHNLSMHFPLSCEVNGDGTAFVDVRKLRSIISNVFQNALQHSEATKVICSIEQCKEMLKLSIQDNGSGYSGSIEKLGEAFYRPHAQSGNGIGLALGKRLAKQSGGRLVISSGKPFALNIFLPASQTA